MVEFPASLDIHFLFVTHALPGLLDPAHALFFELTSDAMNQLRKRENTVIILVEVSEETFEVSLSEVVAVLLEEPGDLVAVKSVVPIHVELSEKSDHASHSVDTFHAQICPDFFQACIGGHANSLELSLNIWVVAGTSASHPS